MSFNNGRLSYTKKKKKRLEKLAAKEAKRENPSGVDVRRFSLRGHMYVVYRYRILALRRHPERDHVICHCQATKKCWK